ncbi:MAG: hypothetical protein KY468_12605 [Armatimonadetes bacterium]|nr:hypothetical protein [Armatimonadota bacterium]
MKRYLLMLPLLCCLASSAGAQNSTVPINTLALGQHVLTPEDPPCPSNEAPPLTGVTPIPIRLLNPVRIAGVQALLYYDATVMEIVNPKGTCLEGMEVRGSVLKTSRSTDPSALIRYDYPASRVGKVGFGVASDIGYSTSGTILTLYARPRPGTPPGTVSYFTIDRDPYTFAMPVDQGFNGTYHFQDGSIVVGAAGDVDHNWQVDTHDAVHTLKFAVLMTPPTSEQKRAADMDRDRRVSVSDTIMVLKKALGFPDL